jgi:ribokinase
MAGRIPKVVVIGGTYVDMAIRCGQIPSPGKSVTGSALSYTATGPGSNQAVEAALCGCEVHLISKVGGDPFAQMAKVSLADFNVNTNFVYTAEAKNTGVFVTLVNAEGENAACYYTGANRCLFDSWPIATGSNCKGCSLCEGARHKGHSQPCKADRATWSAK